LISQASNPSLITLGKRSRQTSTSYDDQTVPVPDARHGEAYVTASVGSNEDLDNLDENLMRDSRSRATGYVGQNSEVQWLRSVQRQTEQFKGEYRPQPHGPPGSGENAANARSDALHERRHNNKDSKQRSTRHVTDSTFYLDSEELDLDMIVDPNEDPHPDVAERLLRCYFETVHPSFPLVRHSTALSLVMCLPTISRYLRPSDQSLSITQTRSGMAEVIKSPRSGVLR
jgi:hypothetical protein